MKGTAVAFVLCSAQLVFGQSCALTASYGDLTSVYIKLGGPSLPPDFCPKTSTCAGNLTDDFKNKWEQANPTGTIDTEMLPMITECMCDSTIAAAGVFLTPGGLVNVPSIAGMNAMCANVNCRAKLMNSDSVMSGGEAALYGLSTPNWFAADGYFANGAWAQVTQLMTECKCDAAAAGYFFYYGRDPGNDGSASDFCAVPSCASLSSALADAQVPGAGKCGGGAPVAAIVGGAVGGAFGGIAFIAWMVTLYKNRQKRNTAALPA